ncbi:MAG: hypothetical protein LBQ48_01435, partial [Oscillospiraceae bacterium]|nr:hypothetical protein [Oscillospiraceae bacterium]
PSVIKTTVYFGLVFLLVLIFNTVTISKQRLINLLYADRKNEVFKTPRLLLSVLLFLVSLGCLGYAYRAVLSGGPAAVLDKTTLITAVISGIIGTFLFFFSLSGFFLKLIQQSKKLYLKNLNLFILRQINSKINTAYVSMTMVCLMLFVSFTTLSSGMGLASSVTEEMHKNAPVDASFSVYAKTDKTVYPGMDLIAAAKKQGVDLSSFSKDSLAVRYYDAGFSVPLKVVENGRELIIDTDVYVLKLSDYNAILALQGVSPIALDENAYAVNFAVINMAFRNAARDYMSANSTVELGNKTLQTVPSLFYRYTLEVSRNIDYNLNLIVDDDLVTGLPIFRDVLHLNFPQQTQEYEKLCASGLSELSLGANAASTLQTKAEVQEVSNSATTVISYIAVYLGIIFLITAAAVLAIGQLSETDDNIGRYGLLRKLGVEESMIKRALFAQIAIYFGVPMLLALAHSAVGVSVAGKLVGAFDQGSIWSGSLFTAAALLVIYGGYFLATYAGSKNILNRDYAQSKKGIE